MKRLFTVLALCSALVLGGVALDSPAQAAAPGDNPRNGRPDDGKKPEMREQAKDKRPGHDGKGRPGKPGDRDKKGSPGKGDEHGKKYGHERGKRGEPADKGDRRGPGDRDDKKDRRDGRPAPDKKDDRR